VIDANHAERHVADRNHFVERIRFREQSRRHFVVDDRDVLAVGFFGLGEASARI
jgi:hypothetical protein